MQIGRTDVMAEKVVLAYSGGLDTSIILKWLCDEGYEVIAYLADVGQKEDFEQAKKKALSLGASKVIIDDLKKEFVENYIFKAIKANCTYEGSYLLGTSLARPVIAKGQIETAIKEKATILSHGATGKGNDQVRFELTYLALMPQAKIISPWKEEKFLKQFQGRTDMIKYASKNGIPVSATKEKPYSTDENIMHTSYESGVLEDPAAAPSEGMFTKTKSINDAPLIPTKIELEFKKGMPIKIKDINENLQIKGALKIFDYLNKIGGENGVGRVDMVENRFVGIKSRGVYETPAGTILLKSHRDLEGLTLDREVSHLKDMLMPKISELIYNGFWFSPEMDFLMAAIEQSQEHVSGIVTISLHKGNCIITGRKSNESLYNINISSMERNGGFNQMDSKGFIRINAIRLQAAKRREK